MIKVVKIGGHVLDDASALQEFCAAFAALPGPKVLVHGGGAMASRLQESLGQTPVKIAGRRVTDADTLQVVTMVYAGWCNKLIVSSLQALGCNAMGLSGCDGNVLTAQKRAPLDGVDYGFVGDVTKASVNTAVLKGLLDQGITPVLTPINHDGSGQLLNTNADTVAASVAAALEAELYLCFEKDGVLDAAGNVISKITAADFEALKASGVVSEGMIPKLANAFTALRSGTPSVYICSFSLTGGSVVTL